jgi:hypothetical protein
MKILMMVSNPFTHDPRVYNEIKSLDQDSSHTHVYKSIIIMQTPWCLQ